MKGRAGRWLAIGSYSLCAAVAEGLPPAPSSRVAPSYGAVEWAVLLLAVLLVLCFVGWFRWDRRRYIVTNPYMVVAAMLWTGSIVVVLASSLSPYHLLWLFAAGYVVSLLAQWMPCSILIWVAKPFWSLCVAGVERDPRYEHRGF